MQLREEACNPCKFKCFVEHRHEPEDFSALQSLNLHSLPPGHFHCVTHLQCSSRVGLIKEVIIDEQ